MGEKCPTCGQPMPSRPTYDVTGAEHLFRLLDDADGRRREIYRTQDGGWAITYGGGSVSPALVEAMVQCRKLTPVYLGSACAYYTGRTIDLDATVAARKRGEISKTALVYA